MADSNHEIVQALRDIADWYEAHPEIDAPPHELLVVKWASDGPSALKTTARALGTFEKEDLDSMMGLNRTFGPVKLRFVFYRERVCQKRVVGTRKVKVLQPAPEAPDVPMVEVEREEEVVEWDCPPLLAPEVEDAA